MISLPMISRDLDLLAITYPVEIFYGDWPARRKVKLEISDPQEASKQKGFFGNRMLF
jgi:hypothetical protein